MKRYRLALLTCAAVLAASAAPAWASVRQVLSGNFYFEEASTGSRSQVVVQQGDQIKVVMVDDAPTPHTVDIDEFGIHSPALRKGETYTTPPLDKVGTFRLYCDPHEQRGHGTTLVVQAVSQSSPPPSPALSPAPTPAPGTSSPAPSPTTSKAPASPPPSPSATRAAGSATGGTGASSGGSATGVVPSPSPGTSSSPTASSAPQPGGDPSSSVAPVGVGTADPSEVEAPPPDPNSLAGLLGRPPAEPGPWTRSVRLGLLALPPLLLVMGAALRRDARRRMMAGPDGPTAASPDKDERVPAGSVH